MIIKRLSVLRTLGLELFDRRITILQMQRAKMGWCVRSAANHLCETALAGPANGLFDATLQLLRLRKTRRVSTTQSAAAREGDPQPIGPLSSGAALHRMGAAASEAGAVRCELRSMARMLRARQPGSGMERLCWLQKYDPGSQ